MSHSKMLIPALIISLISSCGEGRPDYECSCDVDTDGWQTTDTLHFPFRHEAALSGPVCKQLSLALRYQVALPLKDKFPLHVRLLNAQDSALSGYSLRLPVTDAQGLPKGSGWGSITTVEFSDLPYSVQLPDTGSYTLLIWPEEPLTNIMSVTVGLSEK